MSEVKVNKISPRTNCGTVQLGDSGDTITIPSGVTITNNGTQTGFGRTGTVNWDTTVKTAAFTAVSGNGYFCNTTSAAFTVTLPASPSAGDIVAVKDYANTFDTNNLTLGRNSSNIGGQALDSIIGQEGIAVTLVYIDSTKGWLVTDSGLQSEAPGPEFISASGGTETTCGDYKIHTFTGPGTFTVSSGGNSAGSNTVSYMVIGGGGGGALGAGSGDRGGGGGAGGYREGKASTDCYTASPLAATSGVPVTASPYPITVGAGGAVQGSNANGNDGSNSIFSTITSTGGGGGGANSSSGRSGGSGGGGGGGNSTSGGAGNTPSTTPAQGNNGGTGGGSPLNWGGGGGGGASAVGGNAPGSGPGGDGGAGTPTSINGTATGRAGGGGGDKCASSSDGGASGPSACQAATANTGGGGQGGYPGGGGNGTAGGSGIVIIRYKYQ